MLSRKFVEVVEKMKLILFSRFTKFGDAFCRSLKKAFHDFAAMLKGKN